MPIGRSGIHPAHAGRIPALLAFLALAGASPAGAQDELKIGAAAPSVVLEDLEGAPYDFASFLGKKPALIEFWATWCPICENLMPQLRAARDRYGDRVEFLGVNVTVSQSREQVRRYVAEHNPPFRTLWDDQGESVRAYEVTGTSFIVIVDEAGKVAYLGYGGEQNLLGALAKVVGPDPAGRNSSRPNPHQGR